MHVIDAAVAAAIAIAILAMTRWTRLGDRLSPRAAAPLAAGLGVLACLHLLFAMLRRTDDPLSLALNAATLGLPVLYAIVVMLGMHARAMEAADERHVVLAVGAHPDDLELACGGTLARLAGAGAEVHGVVMSRGGRGGDAAKRIAEAEAGARLMGLADIDVFSHPDTRLADAGAEMVQEIEEKIKQVKPTMIFTHSDKDTHQDHVAVHLAVVRAARQHPSILCFESPSVTRAFAPSTFVDIGDQLRTKEAAVALHQDQAGKPYMTGRRIRGIAAFRGSQARTQYAEGFEQVRFQLPMAPLGGPRAAAAPVRDSPQPEPSVTLTVLPSSVRRAAESESPVS